MFQFCPCCRSPRIQFIDNKKFSCPDCGYQYYHNTAAAAGCIINTGTRILFLVRGKNPALGKLDVPGGFINPGEGVLEGLARECREEIGWVPGEGGPPGGSAPRTSGRPRKSKSRGFEFFASFPNTYPYRGIVYNTCDLFFTVTAPGLTEQDLVLEAEEIRGVRFIKPRDVDFEELAFDSTRQAVQAYISYLDSLPV